MIYVLMNPKANNGLGEEDAREWAKCLKEEHKYINVLEIDDMNDFLSSIDLTDEIVLTGGDGTLNHFANDVAQLNLKNKVYYVKSGSGNDFYRDNKEYADELGRIPLNQFLENLPIVIVNGIRRRFLNGIGYGIDGDTCKVGEELRKKSSKHINYKIIAFKLLLGKFKLKNATITVDGQTKEYKNVWLASTMKGRYYGGGVKSAPDQDRFDADSNVSVICMHEKSRLIALLAFPVFSKGKYKGRKWASAVKGKKVEVKFDKPCALQIDGEVVCDVSSYTVEV